MGETKFTDDQVKVIETRDRNILVSAAAGSGKTTVLVERIIRKILGEKADNGQYIRKPVDIDKILVLTFTNAAAAQMREKIVNAISDEINNSKEPDAHLIRQSVLIHNAQITTIHSFCLFLLRNHFAEVNIDPAFKIAEEGEIKLIEGNVVRDLINDLFESDEVENFELLADRITTKNNLDKLKEVILASYKECRNAPYLQEYFEDRRRDYKCESVDELDNTPWMKYMLEQMDIHLDEALQMTKKNIDECKSEGGVAGYVGTLESDYINIEGLKNCKGYRARYEYLQDTPNLFVALKGKKASDSPEAVARAQGIRDSVKKYVAEKYTKKYFFLSPEEIVQALKDNNLIINALMDVLLLFDERLKAEKNKRKVIDFGDMEHYALQILVKRENRQNVPTQVAIDYAGYFDEIMVDEYQDSNRIQEEILEAIAGKVHGRYNRFMVGDVKQSIYSFRQACPDIFVEKYDTYVTDRREDSADNCVRIDLSKNFRSRKEVLDGVNSIFERVMSKDLGMVSYDDCAKLYLGAEYPETNGDKSTELLIYDTGKALSAEKVELEAALVATKILKLKEEKFEVFNFKDKSVRPCDFKDMVILLRSSKGVDEQYKKVLESYGIPTFISSKTGYFSSSEVREMMSLLQVLDNPRQEIPLFGTLKGAFGDFSEEEIAAIKISGKGELYDILKEVALIDTSSDYKESYPMLSANLISKVSEFLSFIDRYREKKLYTLIHILIAEIVEETGYMYKIGSLPYGDQRKANIYMLIEKAKQYEAGSFKGLYHFVKYIEEIKTYDVDYGEAITLDEQSNVVRIMTIHSSKGLEFPICFVCGMGKNYNTPFTKEEIIYDNTLGMGLDRVNLELNIKQKDIRRAVITDNRVKEMAAEEMRVLYVALTRAKEKLIMTGTTEDVESLESLYVEPEAGKKVLPYCVRCDANSYLKLIVSAVGVEGNDNVKVSVVDSESVEVSKVISALSKEERKQILRKSMETMPEISQEAKRLQKRLEYEYPHKNLSGLYTKTSVSELKIAAIEEKLINHDLEGVPAEFFTEHESKAYIPSFVERPEEIKGTTRGTAYHRVMELFGFANNTDFAMLDSDEQSRRIDSEMERMIASERIKREDAELVDKRKIVSFVASDLGQRMCRAASRGELHLEEPFVLQIEASRLGSDYPATEKVLIQGIIDAFFEEDGRTMLMDYKTDRVTSAEELVERYKIQLEYYKEAIEKIRQTEVGEVLIYSFALETTISV